MSLTVDYKFKPPITKVVETLDQIKKGMSRQVQSGALKQALKPIAVQAKSSAPKNLGFLSKSISARIPPLQERKRLRIRPDQGVAVVDPWRKPYKTGELKRFHVAVFFHTSGLDRTPFDPFIFRAVQTHEAQAPALYFEALQTVMDRKLAKLPR